MAKTGIVLDDIYKLHDSGWGHPESPRRIDAIREALEKSGKMSKLIKLDNIKADPAIIANTHDKDYIDRVKKTCENGHPMIDSPDTGIGPQSYEIALYAVGSSINAADLIMKKEIDNAFLGVRPPGHHAEKRTALGFCLFNNIAIVARYLLDHHNLHRIVIMDWDVHHGNGTMHTFYDDPRVYYISTHQSPHYPGTGAVNEKGEGRGLGYTLNIPFNAGTTDEDYRQAFEEKIIPECKNYQPEFVLVSAGYDAHQEDPLAGIKLTSHMYYEMGKMLRDVALDSGEGRIMALLEGGYNLKALGESVEATIDAFSE